MTSLRNAAAIWCMVLAAQWTVAQLILLVVS